MFSFIPLPYKIIILLVLLSGAVALGYMKGLEKSELELAKFQADANAKIAELEKANSEISNTVVTKYVDRVKTVKEKEYVYLDQAKNDVPPQHDLSNGWVYLHDTSSQALSAESSRSTDETSSGVKDNIALSTVVANYSICRQNSEQLRALQQWIIDTKAKVDAQNSEGASNE